MFMWKKYGQFMPFYAPDNGANGGGAGDNGGESGQVVETDYKTLYEKLQADHEKAKTENAKLKASFDKTASEVAELKRASKAKMSEEEQRAAESAEMEQRYKDLQNEVNEMKTATAFAKAGFDEKDYGELVKQVVAVGGDKSSELAETFLTFVKKSNAAAVASAKNGAIRDGAVTPNASSAQGGQGGKSDYQLYQESKTKTNNIVEL